MVSSLSSPLASSSREDGRLEIWRASAKRAFRSARRTVLGWADQERGRFLLFAPWLMGLGILLWFALPHKPAPWLLMLAAGASSLAWLLSLYRGEGKLVLALRLPAFILIGALLIALRTEWVATPLLADNLPPSSLTGVVKRIELRERDQRITVRVVSMEGVADESLPRQVRFVWRGERAAMAPGDLIAVRAKLSPPPGPALVGGYDFSRHMYYLGIGGTGFALAPPEVLKPSGNSLLKERLRDDVAARVEAQIGGTSGAVAAALVTGQRERIPQHAVDALRDAGLAHLLAISGLHMGLVCGFVFWAARFLLTRSTWLAATFPLKKWAAALALAAGSVYLLLSGGAWSAQRAYIMAAIIFGAMLVDRQGLSLRNVALAALVILILRPEALLSPGFQMSFAATACLIAAFEHLQPFMDRFRDKGVGTRLMTFLVGLVLTSFIAGLATGPYAAFHFGRIAAFGLVGNLLAMPMVTLVVMPTLVIALFLMPLGLDGPVLQLAGYGLDLALAVATWTSGLPGAVQFVPQLAPMGLLLGTAGLVVVVMLRAPWRLCGLGFIAAGWVLSWQTHEPDVWISRNLKNVGIRMSHASPEVAPLAVISRSRDRFTLEAWLQAIGAPLDLEALKPLEGCDLGPCGDAAGRVLIVPNRTSLREACAAAEVVILRAQSEATDQQRCAALLLSLDASGHFPPTTLRRSADQWVIRTATQFSKVP